MVTLATGLKWPAPFFHAKFWSVFLITSYPYSRSHTALDKNKNKGASGKGKKQDKLQQPPAKDGRKSEQGKKDDKKRGKNEGYYKILTNDK